MSNRADGRKENVCGDDPASWTPIIECAFVDEGNGSTMISPDVAAAEAKRRVVLCSKKGWHKILKDLYTEAATYTKYSDYIYDPQPQVVDAINYCEPEDEKGRIVTYIVSKAGYFECLQFFLEKFSADSECSKGAPIHAACKKGHLECVKLLLTKFPNAEKPDANGQTPLQIAQSRGFTECATAIDAYIHFCRSVPAVTRWVTCTNSSPCTQVQSIACECASVNKDVIVQGENYSLEKGAEFRRIGTSTDTFRCVGAVPYAITSYVCVYQNHLPPLIPKFPKLELPSLQVEVGTSSVGILSLPQAILVKIFTLCRRPCPCVFHSKTVNNTPYLRLNVLMHGFSCYNDLPFIPWNLYECAYTLCTLELVCTAFHDVYESGRRILSLPEQAAQNMCFDFGITNREAGRCWKEQLMLHDIVGREFALRSDPKAIELARTCFTGDGEVSLQDGKRKVSAICVGDKVLTEDGTYLAIKRVNKEEAFKICNVVVLQGVVLTPGHPVLSNGEWTHPFEVAPVTQKYVTMWYNFELEGGPSVTNHSVVINGLVVCTLGKDCGSRITTGWPKQDKLFGRGYWSNNPNATHALTT